MKRSIIKGLRTPYRIRQVVQGLFFVLFLYLFGRAAFPLRSILPVDLFLRMDPLLGLTVLFADKVVIAGLLLAVPLMLATVLWGRFFCAYMCPMGTSIDVLDFLLLRKVPRRGLKNPLLLRNLPYYLLFSMLGASLLGIVFLHLLDPICIITRTSALVFFPFFLRAGNLGLDLLRLLGRQLDIPGLVHAPYDQAAFSMNILTLLLFGVIIGLSAVEPRFWCRNVCPLGGLFSLLARLSPFRGTLSEACIECGRCTQICPLDAVAGRPEETIGSTCSLCLTCLSICPEHAISFGMGRSRRYTEHRPIDLSRRGLRRWTTLTS